MKYIKYDYYTKDINCYDEVIIINKTSFIELDDDDYEIRRLNFHKDKDLNQEYLSFFDKKGSYLGAFGSEYAWRAEVYSKEGVFNIYKPKDGFCFSFYLEMKKEDFDKIWESVVEKYLIGECGVKRDTEEDDYIDFDIIHTFEVLPKHYLEYFHDVSLQSGWIDDKINNYANCTYAKTWLNNVQIKQLQDFFDEKGVKHNI